MHNSKLISVLDTLDHTEWKDFGRYLIFIKGSKTEEYQLYRYIYKCRDDLQHRKLVADEVIDSIFTGKDRKNFFNLMSRLCHWALEYIGYLQYQKEWAEKALIRQRAFQERGLFKLAVREKRMLDRDIDQAPHDIWSGYHRLRAQHTLKYSSNPLRLEDRHQLISDLLDAWLDLRSDLDYYYHIDIHHNNEIWGLALGHKISGITLGSFQREDNRPLKWLYKYKFDGDDESYQKLVSYLKENSQQISSDYGMAMIMHLIQKEGQLIRDGVRSPANLAYLYHLSAELGWLIKDDRISIVNFSVMIHSACFDDDRDLAGKYLVQWAPFLPPDKRDETVSLNEATICFYRGEHDMVIEILRSQKFNVLSNKNSARVLLLMTYYELYKSDKNFINQQVVNYVSYIHRSKNISEGYRKGCLHFAKVIKLLTAGNVDQVKAIVQSDVPLIRKSWLRLMLK